MPKPARHSDGISISDDLTPLVSQYPSCLASVGRMIEEGNDLGPGAGGVGGEGSVAGAAGDPLIHRPADGVGVLRPVGDVGDLLGVRMIPSLWVTLSVPGVTVLPKG